MDSFTPRNWSCSSSAFPAAAPHVIPTQQQCGHLPDCHGFHSLGEQKMPHWCLNVPSGFPHKSHTHQQMKIQEIDPCGCWRLVIPRKEIEGNTFPSRTCSLSHTLAAPLSSLSASATPDSLKAGVKGCRGVHYVKIHQQIRPFQARDHPSIAVRANKTQGYTSLPTFLKMG